MWVEGNTKKVLENREEYKYMLNENVICCIKKVKRRANTLKISWLELYRGRVYYKVMFNQDHLQQKRIDIVYDEDLDVLKLKCLVKAKGLGWDIKSLS